jgi:hypothetical protein
MNPLGMNPRNDVVHSNCRTSTKVSTPPFEASHITMDSIMPKRQYNFVKKYNYVNSQDP